MVTVGYRCPNSALCFCSAFWWFYFYQSQRCDRVDLTRHSNFKPSMLHCCDTGNYCMRVNHLVFCQRQSECHLSSIIRTFRRSQQAAFLKCRRLSAFVIEWTSQRTSKTSSRTSGSRRQKGRRSSSGPNIPRDIESAGFFRDSM
jgi:hypothetical protein